MLAAILPLLPGPPLEHSTMGGNIAASAPSQDWPPPNYDDPVTREWLPIYLWCLHGVTTLLVAIRLILRLRKEAGGFGLDDVRRRLLRSHFLEHR